MRKILIIYAVLLIMACMALSAFSPDMLSIAVCVCMLLIATAGMLFGIFPMLLMERGLQTGVKSINSATMLATDSMWYAIQQMTPVFRQKTLDALFESYRDRTNHQQATGQMIGDISDYINEEALSLYSWNSVIVQIPGTLTGLGILGTFAGLIIGINGIGFSSVDAALESVQTLLSGIHTAFYTSIAGVILSILFNILQKMSWNMMTRRMTIFIDEFHKKVVPPVEEQERYRNQKQMQLVLERLDRIPKTPGYSVGNNTQMNPVVAQKNEAILMPQITDGLKKGEFVFVLQPKYDIVSRNMFSAEAYVRWKHAKLGFVSPSVFLPIVEENGYITKLDEYIWESVFQKLREWMDAGEPVLPISVNISKTDILAGNVINVFSDFSNKYQIPPRMIDIEVARNAFFEAREITANVTAELRQKGFKVILDGFDGDFVPLDTLPGLSIDELKLDLRDINMRTETSRVREIFTQAKQIGIPVSVEGIESMEQVTFLRKCGCLTGQGYFFSKPMMQEEFIASLKK